MILKKKSTPINSEYFEFSKILVRRGLLIFFIQVILTVGIIFFRIDSSVQAVSLMSTTIPLYAIMFGGYFGKAGLENYQKIKNSCFHETDDTPQDP